MQMGDLLEGKPAQPGEGLAFPSKLKYPFFLQGGVGEYLKAGGGGGVSFYLWFYLFILKDLVSPKPLAPAKPSRAVPLSHTRE